MVLEPSTNSYFAGRGDATHSMSCTDKILRWTALGMHGALLSHFIDPIHLAAIVIGELFNQVPQPLSLSAAHTSRMRVGGPGSIDCRRSSAHPMYV